MNALVVRTPHEVTGETSIQSAVALEEYYRSEVIHGANAFAMIANGYADYQRAMRLKLLKELAPPVFGALQLP